MINTKIEKLIFGGQGLGRFDKKIILAWNALPGEEVEIEVNKDRRGYIEGVAKNIIIPSPHREPPKEKHFLSCSPWQILSWPEENNWKQKIAVETYNKIGGLAIGQDVGITYIADEQYNYRNKMEFSFCLNAHNKISLAFFGRDSHYLRSIDGCELANKAINETVLKIVDWLNQINTPIDILKSLIIRSNSVGQTIAALFVKDEFQFADFPEINKLVGFYIYLSNPMSPASTPDKLISKQGQNFLINNIDEVDLKFGLLSFFQVNVPVFTKVLRDIKNFLNPDSDIIDYYSGVGAISLPLNKFFENGYLVESNPEAVYYANENIKSNNIDNCQAKLMPAERAVDLISSEKIIIFDPPRAGLHEKIIEKVLEEKPIRVIYLSCNISTQARDIKLLSESYKIKFLHLYNFFPRTPHIEALSVLERN